MRRAESTWPKLDSERVFLNPAGKIHASEPEAPAPDADIGQAPRADQLIERATRNVKQSGRLCRTEKRLRKHVKTA